MRACMVPAAMGARIRARWAFIEAVVGETARAKALIAAIDASKPIAPAVEALFAAAIAGDRTAVDRLASAVPSYLPPIARNSIANARVLLDLQRERSDPSNRIRPPVGGEVMTNGPALRPVYIRALAYLHGGAADLAASEFTRVIDHPETVPESPLHALSHLGLARALMRLGDRAKAGDHYREFFGRWKDADPDVPALREARTEYAKLSTTK